jgi:methylglutaconyl-CoA hydratase
MSAELLENREGAVVVLTLNRPAKRNALTLELVRGLRARIQAAVADESVGGIVLTGSPPAFCAGMDLNAVVAVNAGAEARVASDEPAEARGAIAIVSELTELYREIDTAPKPIVAAVNGAAVAGGAGLVTVCDIAVAGESALIGYPEIRRGVVAAVVMGYLVRSVGERRARCLLLTGDLISAQEAQKAGLVTACVADQDCVPEAIELARRLASYPPAAFAETKRLLAEVWQADPASAVEQARKLHARFSVDAGAAEAIERFLKKE